MSIRCSACDGENDRAPQRYCSKCHADYQRRWRRARTQEFRNLLANVHRHAEANI